METQADALRKDPHYLSAKTALLESIAAFSSKMAQAGIRPAQSELRVGFEEMVKVFQRDRGRELYFPYLASGLGSGPFVELTDGSVKLDLIAGIGVNLFGHSHPELMSEVIDAVASDVMQGNLQPGIEAQRLIRTLLSMVEQSSRLRHGWLMCSGTMVNEVALKIIRQKKFPATKVMAFADGFHGRSTAMQELTDSPGYRQGQPTYGIVDYVPGYEMADSLETNLKRTLDTMRVHFKHNPGQYAALLLEPIQGEGGFNYGPKSFYDAIFSEAKKNGLAIWLDEIQTFGRTGELFAFQKLGLGPHVDVVTAAKLLQASMVLYTEEYNPKPGLVAGTFTGSAASLRAGRRTLEILRDEKYFGSEGKIERLSKHFVVGLKALQSKNKQYIGEIRAIGAMIGFVPHDGKMETVKRVLFKLYDLGVVAFYCGHGPYLIRMLPPLGAMNESQIDLAVSKIGEALDATGGSK